MARWIWQFAVSCVLISILCSCNLDRRDSSESEVEISASDQAVPKTDISRRSTSSGSRGSGNALANSSPVMRRTHADDRAGTEPAVMVSGTVKFDNGVPITSATVELWGDDSGIVGGAAKDQRLDQSPVNEDGQYSVSGRDGSGLRVEVKGLSRAIADIDARDKKSTEPVKRKVVQNFVIPAPEIITGRVTDMDDNPVTSALVSLRSEDVVEDGWYYGNQQTTVSASGEFTLAGVARGNATIGAVADGFSPMTAKIAVPTTGPVELRLTSGSVTLHGTLLLFPGSGPVVGAKVSIRPAGTISTLGISRKAALQATSDSNGLFSMEHLVAGKHIVTVKAADGTVLMAAPGEPFNAIYPVLQGNQTTAVTFIVFAGYKVSGIVHDKDTSEPLSGVAVSTAPNSINQEKVITGEDGKYRLTGIDAHSSLRLEASLDGYEIASGSGVYSIDGHRAITVNLPARTDTTTFDIPMIQIVRIRGRVETQDKTPVAGAYLKWETSFGQSSGDAIETNSDVDGQFVLEVFPLQKGVINVKAEGYAPKSTSPMEIGSNDVNDVVITVDQEATVDGKVVDNADKPIGNARITIKENHLDYMRYRELGVSGADGSFHAGGFQPGNNMLFANAENYSAGKTTLNLTAGEHKTDVVIRLNDELTIEGRVIDSQDKGVEARVSSRGEDDAPSHDTKSDKTGHFVLRGVEAGKHTLFVNDEKNSRNTQVITEAGVKDLVIRLDDAGVIHCKVVDSNSKQPIEDFLIGGSEPTETDGEGPGGFRVTLTPGLSTNRRITAEGYTAKTFNISAPTDGKEKTQLLEMGIGSGVNGRVVSLGSGEPLPNIPVAAYEAAGFHNPASGNSVTGDDGKFLISKIPAGKMIITAIPAKPLAPASKKVEIKDGEFPDIGDIEVGELAEVHGKVSRRSSGAPVTDSGVRLSKMFSSESQEKNLLQDGSFAFSDIPPGKYNVLVTKYESFAKQVEVKSGDNLEVNITIGAITMRGTVSADGQTTQSFMIIATNLENGQKYGAQMEPGVGYQLTEMEPGDYEIKISSVTRTNGSVDSWEIHAEQFTLPDQPIVQKDFVIP